MNRPRLIRWLRISASAACLIICVLLIALWVRSYYWQDFLKGSVSGVPALAIVSDSGVVFVGVHGWEKDNPYYLKRWQLFSSAPQNSYAKRPHLFHLHRSRSGPKLVVPIWFFVLVAGVMSITPWIPWSRRFSLRTLLIVMTLVAAVLGIGVWLTR